MPVCTIVSLYVATCISIFKSRYYRVVSMLDMQLICNCDTEKNIKHVCCYIRVVLYIGSEYEE